MTKFIKLHETCGNDTVKAVLISVECIEHVTIGKKGTDTYVKLITPSHVAAKESWFFVKETVEEIEKQLFALASK
jgi:hypothetical protein